MFNFMVISLFMNYCNGSASQDISSWDKLVIRNNVNDPEDVEEINNLGNNPLFDIQEQDRNILNINSVVEQLVYLFFSSDDNTEGLVSFLNSNNVNFNLIRNFLQIRTDLLFKLLCLRNFKKDLFNEETANAIVNDLIERNFQIGSPNDVLFFVNNMQLDRRSIPDSFFRFLSFQKNSLIFIDDLKANAQEDDHKRYYSALLMEIVTFISEARVADTADSFFIRDVSPSLKSSFDKANIEILKREILVPNNRRMKFLKLCLKGIRSNDALWNLLLDLSYNLSVDEIENQRNFKPAFEALVLELVDREENNILKISSDSLLDKIRAKDNMNKFLLSALVRIYPENTFDIIDQQLTVTGDFNDFYCSLVVMRTLHTSGNNIGNIELMKKIIENGLKPTSIEDLKEVLWFFAAPGVMKINESEDNSILGDIIDLLIKDINLSSIDRGFLKILADEKGIFSNDEILRKLSQKIEADRA